MWVRLLSSGQEVSYDGLPFPEVVALATALDEWEALQFKRSHSLAKDREAHAQVHTQETGVMHRG